MSGGRRSPSSRMSRVFLDWVTRQVHQEEAVPLRFHRGRSGQESEPDAGCADQESSVGNLTLILIAFCAHGEIGSGDPYAGLYQVQCPVEPEPCRRTKGTRSGSLVDPVEEV